MGHKYKLGYTGGTFDLFHIGHLNILRQAREMCETLIVSVTPDEEVMLAKQKMPFIPFDERVEILKAIRYVDQVIIQEKPQHLKAFEDYRYDVAFIGDDWKGSAQWNEIEATLACSVGVSGRPVDVIYLPYTKTTSSTKIQSLINKRLEEPR